MCLMWLLKWFFLFEMSNGSAFQSCTSLLFESHTSVRTGLEGPGLTFAQKLWYCVATVGGQYIWARLQSFSAFRRWGDSEQVFLYFLFKHNQLSLFVCSIFVVLP